MWALCKPSSGFIAKTETGFVQVTKTSDDASAENKREAPTGREHVVQRVGLIPVNVSCAVRWERLKNPNMIDIWLKARKN
jgi:hypothetical protein